MMMALLVFWDSQKQKCHLSSLREYQLFLGHKLSSLYLLRHFRACIKKSKTWYVTTENWHHYWKY
jgi:hypothetical protein